MTRHSAIYKGDVVHTRLRPKRHRLRYSVFTLFLDLDELPSLDRGGLLFGYNRPALLSFYDRDHGPVHDGPLRPWAEERLRAAGLPSDGGPIRLLCYPRVFGYVFNPISTFFCYRRDGKLTAILYEVCNTFKERHTYVVPVPDDTAPVIRQSCAKALYVSPFIGMTADYHFRIVPPDHNVSLVIRQEDPDGLLLAASFRGIRTSFTGRALTWALVRFPFMTLKVIGGIHWEALKLWLKGLPVFAHRPADRRVSSSTEHSSLPTSTN